MPKPVRRAANPEPAPRKEPAYPYYYWKKCLEVAEAVRALGGGRADVNKSMLAHQLNMSEDSSSLSQLVASAKTFGMIQGWGTYRLTDNGQRYFFPTAEGEDRRAALAFLATPAAYRLLVERFDGNVLPPDKMLSHLLLKEGGVPESWRDRAASIFKDAVNNLGLIDGGGRLRYKVAMQSAARSSPDDRGADGSKPELPPAEGNDKPPVVPPPSPTPAQDRPKPAGTGRNVWNYTEAGGTVVVDTPNPLPRALWVRLTRYVEMLEPPEEGVGDESK